MRNSGLFPRVIFISITLALAVSLAVTTPGNSRHQVVEAATFTVTNTNDNGLGSLRQAITDANNNPGLDTIDFNIPEAGPHTIQPLSELPNISDSVVIDGFTQPGASANTNPITQGSNAVMMIELDGSNAGLSSEGLGTGNELNELSPYSSDERVKHTVPAHHTFQAIDHYHPPCV